MQLEQRNDESRCSRNDSISCFPDDGLNIEAGLVIIPETQPLCIVKPGDHKNKNQLKEEKWEKLLASSHSCFKDYYWSLIFLFLSELISNNGSYL
ncbi:hypothetical protein V6N13_142106 [Hibiscus sabdariffa]|uniref:Uncharacterized protein n=1 Tax=Hibiscus sabdariffa TaxID=183260 RepID=A0ABR2FD27_9ROSI